MKLVSLDTEPRLDVRQFFMRSRDKFRLANVRAALYDIRCRDLTTGAYRKSEPFRLYVTEEQDGEATRRRYNTISLTLYKVVRGNTKVEVIDESDF